MQPEKRYRQRPGNGQTTVGDRLQPSLTASSMFNAVGQRGGRAWAATLMEVSTGVSGWRGDLCDVLEECDGRLSHKASSERYSHLSLL